MRYQQILYSRSLSQDYRWMILPDGISNNDIRKLKQLYDMFDREKRRITTEQVSAIYCLSLFNATYLLSCSRSNDKDVSGRTIYVLQGISVEKPYIRHFWFALPWLLLNHKQTLNLWQHINFKQADQLDKEQSKVYEVSLDKVQTVIPELVTGSSKLEGKLMSHEAVSLDFNAQGFEELVLLTASPLFSLSNFAFGATSEMLDHFKFSVFAPIDPEVLRIEHHDANAGFSEAKQNILVHHQDSTQFADRVPLPPSTSESQPDPTDRFDPRRKDTDKSNVSKPNTKKTKKMSLWPWDMISKAMGLEGTEKNDDE